jgi:hypothetical protein
MSKKRDKKYDQVAPIPATVDNISAHDIAIGMLVARYGVPKSEDMIKFMHKRKMHGLEKYGTVLHADNGRNAALDLLEELSDALAYATILYQQGFADLRLMNGVITLYHDAHEMWFQLGGLAEPVKE